jgi:hypothetical protein
MNTADAATTFTAMLHAIDARDWDGVRNAFADRIDLNYQSLFGAPATTVDRDAHVAGWRSFAGAFDATQHITGPILVSETSGGATASTHVRAYHYVNGAAGATYGWRITVKRISAAAPPHNYQFLTIR